MLYLQHAPVGFKKAGLYLHVIEPMLIEHPFRTTASAPAGIRMSVDTDDLVGRYIYVFGIWEPSLTQFVKHRLAPGDVFIDLGANTGYYSLVAARLVGPEGRVIAVEASPSTYRLLEHNIQLNHLGNIHAINCAVSDAEGSLQLYGGPATNRGMSTVVAKPGFAPEAVVRTAPFDKLVDAADLRHTRLIKIDVEGHEPQVLERLFPLLDATRDDLEILLELTGEQTLAEQGVRQRDILDAFADHGFWPYLVDNDYYPLTYMYGGHKMTARRFASDAHLEETGDLIFSRLDVDTLGL